MGFLWDGLGQAWHLVVSGDPFLWHLVWVTAKVTLVSTGVAIVIGLPLGLLLGLGRFRGRGFGLALANAGLVLPPVAVGLVLSLLMFPQAPLGRFHLLFTLNGVFVAQSLLAIPILVALTSSAADAVPPGLLQQARALGAGRTAAWWLGARECRVGIVAAIIAAAGSALSEVGAVVLVGGNIEGVDQTLASAALEKVDAGRFAEGAAIAIVLLGVIVVVIGSLTVLQHRDRRGR